MTRPLRFAAIGLDHRHIYDHVANLVAAIGFAAFGPVHWGAAAAMALGAVAGGWCGPPVVRRIPPDVLRVSVALAGFGLAVWLAVR